MYVPCGTVSLGPVVLCVRLRSLGREFLNTATNFSLVDSAAIQRAEREGKRVFLQYIYTYRMCCLWRAMGLCFVRLCVFYDRGRRGIHHSCTSLTERTAADVGGASELDAWGGVFWLHPSV